MASISKHGTSWRAQVKIKGKRKSKVFATKKAASVWALEQESILASDYEPSKLPFGQVMQRYADTVSIHKRGSRWEQIRIAAFQRDKIAEIPVSELSTGDIGHWRDRRLQSVGPATVRREMTILRHILETARRDWGLIDKSPAKDVKKPKEPPARDRVITQTEIDKMLEALAYSDDEPIIYKQQIVAIAFLFAIETGMRAGELLSLTPEKINGRTARLDMTKNGLGRDVPLSKRALELYGKLPGGVFGMTGAQLDALFRKARTKAGLTGFTFHDTRHLAVIRLSKKLDVLDLARMIGHTNLNQLRTYYNRGADDIAGDLD